MTLSQSVDVILTNCVSILVGMETLGRVQNGVVVFEGGPPLPEGTPVVVSTIAPTDSGASTADRVQFPLIRSKRPGSVDLTSETIAQLLSEKVVSS